MNRDERRARLGQFLRACRERVLPGEPAINDGSRRRTPGLRREEVAEYAGISAAYYTKIEQGRVDVPPHVLDALATALGLNHVERGYAFSLAEKTAVRRVDRADLEPSPALLRLLELQEPNPVQIINHRWDFVAWNDATRATIVDLEAIPPSSRNLVVMMFTEPMMRLFIEDWETNAKGMLAEFRADYGRYHADPTFSDLIARLSDASPEFKRWWVELPHVGAPSEIPKVLHHPSGETLHFQEMALAAVDHPGLRVLFFLPQDEETRMATQRLLDAWRATQKPPPSGDGRRP